MRIKINDNEIFLCIRVYINPHIDTEIIIVPYNTTEYTIRAHCSTPAKASMLLRELLIFGYVDLSSYPHAIIYEQ